MGDYMFKIGDYVTRKSYNNDIIFKIIDIKDSVYYLKGVDIRLCADSIVDDLCKTSTIVVNNFNPNIFENKNLNRSEYFYLPGKILHIDGDKDYLKICMDFYNENKLKVNGIFLKESDISSKIYKLLCEYKPDILVITGHDSFSNKKNHEYINTSFFIEAIKVARKYEKSHDKLFIIAGACQSDYKNLIKAGANFASSPNCVNVHALDPAVIAACLAFSNRNENINILKIINKTKYGVSGFGGIITKGSMYIGYPR